MTGPESLTRLVASRPLGKANVMGLECAVRDWRAGRVVDRREILVDTLLALPRALQERQLEARWDVIHEDAISAGPDLCTRWAGIRCIPRSRWSSATPDSKESKA